MTTSTGHPSPVGTSVSSPSNNIHTFDFAPRRRRNNSVDVPRYPGRATRSNSASNILDTHDDFQRRLYDPLLAPHLQRKPTHDNGLTDLVDFLRNHAPPPDNFMSIPENENDERGRGWVKWKNIGKRSKSLPRRPRPIRLPDTAVSGKTIGGHRHIAITIPSEAFPLGDMPRSQYPVYSQGAMKPGSSDSSIQTFINDRGVVTVLRTVEEHRAQGTSERYTPLGNIRYGAHARAASRNGYTISTGSSSLPPSRGSGSVTLADNRQQQGREANRTTQASSQRHPSRASSKAKMNAHPPASIDSIIAQENSLRPLLDIADEADQADLALQMYATKPLPPIKPRDAKKIAQEEKATGIGKESGAKLLKYSPLGTSKDKLPATPSSATNRRDKVRDKKLRDIEAVRVGRQQEQPAEQGDASTVALPRKSSKRTSQEAKEAQAEQSKPTLSPILVVANFEPSPAVEDVPLSEEPKSSKAESKMPHLETARPILNRNSAPGYLSPPVLPQVQPAATTADPETKPTQPLASPKKQTPSDRTALSRRREWKATREQERKTQEARASVRARAKQLAAGLGDESSESMQNVDREILRLYEAYREHRFRDMERRLRRLERNGDVWLRALVPVLETLNHHGEGSRPNSALIPGQEEAERKAWASDDELATQAFNREVLKRKLTPLKRASSSHKTMREEMADGDANSLYGSVSESEDLSGLDAIEPLMRELAGAAALRQMRSGKLLQAY